MGATSAERPAVLQARGWVGVLEGLTAGEMVIVHPGEMVRDGSRVEAG